MKRNFLLKTGYEVWLESNAQGGITLIRIILKPWFFQDIFRLRPCRSGCTFCSGSSTSTAKRRQRTVFEDGSDDAQQAHLEAVLARWEVNQLRLDTTKDKKKSAMALFGERGHQGPVADRLLPSLPFEVPEWGGVVWATSLLKKTSPGTTIWDFWTWKPARTYLVPFWWFHHRAATPSMTLMVRFGILIYVSYFFSCDEGIISLYDIFFFPYAQFTANFISCQLLAALASAATKLRASIIARTVEGRGISKVLGPAKRLIRAFCPQKLPNREWLVPICMFVFMNFSSLYYIKLISPCSIWFWSHFIVLCYLIIIL